ncbi:MAG: hypothetical protein IJ877_01625 [Candidatus Gastranaerophilales bacterium]|nr:hypothetical protein [Candidatus Gastranaerophilales bacterium]
MNNLKIFGKFLDQPMLVAKFQKAIPAVLVAGGTAYTAYDASKAKKGQRGKRVLKTGVTMGATIASALAAPYIASKITKRPLPQNIQSIKTSNTQIIDSFIKSTKLSKDTKLILNKSKERILSFKDVKTLFNNIGQSENGYKFLNKLIPEPQNVKAKDIFSEIGYLSVYGAIPVVGGIAGGTAADKITDKEHAKENFPNKVKEGLYQYLANIFMCNVGAGIALGILEKLGITSKGARAAGMTAGIAATGIIGGSKIANFIDKKVISPIFKTKAAQKERTPEVLDIGLHTDDIATVSLLSGLKWIEPALPVMYSLSGYRAGIGYRN